MGRVAVGTRMPGMPLTGGSWNQPQPFHPAELLISSFSQQRRAHDGRCLARLVQRSLQEHFLGAFEGSLTSPLLSADLSQKGTSGSALTPEHSGPRTASSISRQTSTNPLLLLWFLRKRTPQAPNPPCVKFSWIHNVGTGCWHHVIYLNYS